MNPQRYPVGIQTFSEIIGKGYVYVDKSAFIPRLFNAGKYIFLSRPRRFGKSLLLSMLHSFFAGERHLFKGLEIDSSDVDWATRPVIHIDLNAENFTLANGLDILLDRILGDYERQYDITDRVPSPAGRLSRIIMSAYETTGKRPAILVDEYDKPLLAIEHGPAIFNRNQATLKAFFGVLKSMDRYIHFAMLTGVARFNKVSIFSDLNNLLDISFNNSFANICGWTQQELEDYFTPGINVLADEQEITPDEAFAKMKDHYDGYLFAPKGQRLYNPYSVLLALTNREFGRYWFQTGTPTFLARRVKETRIILPSLNGCQASLPSLEAVGIDDLNPIPLLFQTGYLTIKSARGNRYELQFPNREVETGFAEHLLPLYVPGLGDLNGDFSMWKFEDDIAYGRPETFMLRLQALIKDVPYEQHDEKFYQNAVYLVFTLAGAHAKVEDHTNIGRTDLEVTTGSYIYIFEFKYNRSAREALAQIRQRDYAGRHAMSGKRVFLIGANFSSAARGLDEWIIEEWVK